MRQGTTGLPEGYHLYNREDRMLHDVVSAVYRGGYLIELEFDDGQRGTVDFAIPGS